MLGSQLETAVKTTLSFLKVCEDWLFERVVIRKSGCGKTTVIFNLLLQSLRGLVIRKSGYSKEWLFERVDVEKLQ